MISERLVGCSASTMRILALVVESLKSFGIHVILPEAPFASSSIEKYVLPVEDP